MLKRIMVGSILGLLLVGLVAMAKSPVTQSCEGWGPDSSTAKLDAIAKCMTLASEQLSKSVKIRSASVETEKDVSYFSSVESSQEVQNLNCNIVDSKCEEKSDRTFCKIKCKFDLKQAIVKVGPETVSRKSSSSDDLSSKNIKSPQTDLKSDSFQVSISTIPKCRIIQVLGRYPRTIQCSANPVELVLSSEDELLRFITSGYREVEMSLSQIKERGANVQILFK